MGEEDEEAAEDDGEEEKKEDVLQCSECDSLYADNKDTRRIANKIGKFVCPRCLTEFYAEHEAKAKAPKKGKAPAAPTRAPAAPAAPPAAAPLAAAPAPKGEKPKK